MSLSAGKPPKIGHSDCLSYLLSLGDVLPEDAALQLAQRIRAEEEEAEAMQGDTCGGANQAALNVSFRVYYHIVHKYELKDTHFGDLPVRLSCEQPSGFLMLQSVLLTDHWKQLDADLLEEKCTTAIIEALRRNSPSLMAVLKAANLLVKKFPRLELLALRLEHFYQCLQRQNQTGSREEALTLYNHCCKQQKRAYSYFRVIAEFWPWTNRNKYYLLSGILNSHALPELLAATNQSEAEFFNGLRLSLSYKGLRAASQYPVKSLSNQRSPALLAASVELLVSGSVAEIQNFHSQWFLRIQQRDVLFELLQANPQIVEFLACCEDLRSPADQLRLILIFSMFAKEIYAASKLHFFKISTELLTNCSHLETEAQLLVFRFLVDNLANFAVEDCLEFFHSFLDRHRGVESSEFRNTMLGKMPTIINHTAKHFHRALKTGGDGLSVNIKRFFSHLQELIERDIKSDVYQPKIFALKLLEILNRSLYAENVAKNAKMCSTQQNQRMGAYLLELGVFRPQVVAKQLFDSLNDPQGFDDALDLTVSLLIQLRQVDTELCVERCNSLCLASDVDECSLVSLYAQLAVVNESSANKLFDVCSKRLREQLPSYMEDPLLAGKAGGHLFGYLRGLDEVVRSGGPGGKSPLEDLLPLLERILGGILKFLNLANARRQDDMAASAASFQDMDESLHLLVSESSFKSGVGAEACRKYLLMSFWLTLKGCCDLATSIGCSLLQATSKATVNVEALRRCLDINVSVLTLCRHKGAIEAAGLSIGRLTRGITSSLESQDAGFQMLHDCLERELLTENRQVSTTRRGAGFAIMFLHVLKNDNPRQRLILHRAVQQILKRLNDKRTPENTPLDSINHDRWEALVLHYLCVLVRDTELRPAMSKYYNEILLVAMEHIDNAEWTISNAALQLFGSSLGKLVGQRQATEFETRPVWEPSELDYDELGCLLPKACEHMLDCCDRQEVTSSIILFLAFLSKVEHLRTSGSRHPSPLLLRFRRLSWRLLRHKCDQVRQLAGTCFVRTHEFRCDLPAVLLASAKLAARLDEENFYEGLIYALTSGVHKLQHEARHVWGEERLVEFFVELLTSLDVTQERVSRLKPYTLNVLKKLLKMLGGADKSASLAEILGSQ